MAAFYIDDDVSNPLAGLLLSDGHDVVTVRSLEAKGTPDARHLVAAAQQGRILVTHNRDDCRLLHDAWVYWSGLWSVSPLHAGILILDQSPPKFPLLALREVIQSDLPLTNQLYLWSPATGWIRAPKRGRALWLA